MRIRQSVLVVAAFLGLLTSCMKLDILGQFEGEHFPHGVGSSWRYAYSNSDGMMDTVTYRIVEANRRLPNELLADVWAINNQVQQSSDTMYVRVTKDSVIFYSQYYYQPDRVWHLPLLPGQSWHDVNNVGLASDSVTVQEPYTLVVPAGSFPNTYSIHRQQTYVDNTRNESYWLSPNVGITKMSKEQQLLPSSIPLGLFTEEWVLLDYNLQ